MRISEFDFQLPAELVAQTPPEKRESSRMLIVNRADETVQDEQFRNFSQFLKKTDVLVLNNTKVFPARLFGKNETGARIEIFLVRELENKTWETLARPARRLKIGAKVFFGDDLTATVLEKNADGHVFVEFKAEKNFDEILNQIGQIPLPPYIKRDNDNGNLEQDRERYQTVFAKNRGAIAAPTAGLHFTPDILDALKNTGVKIVEITLHVGYGTFEPVRVSDLAEHKVMPERFEITSETAKIINEAKAANCRIIAVGTTTTRALESSVDETGKILAGSGLANLTIVPDYDFKIVGGLLTNFHLPKSSLLVLVSTFAGYNLTLKAYKHAVDSRYRFYSYGDCMLIL
jgi:S-adenosylmethionine:tRNA ribosyltransferase-isomerase